MVGPSAWRLRFWRRLVLAMSVSAIIGSMVAGPALASSAADFIQSTGEQAFRSVSAKNISDAEREERFRSLFKRNFDLPQIARFVMGRYWRRASDRQRREYFDLFEHFIVQAYSFRFKDLSGEILRIGTIHKLNERDLLVASAVEWPGGKRVRVDWRVRGTGSEYRIIDVVVEGISMLITQREEFAAVIRSNGGKVEGLLAALRKRTGRSR